MTSFLMRTSSSSILDLDGCQWQMLERTLMDHSSSLQQRKPPGWMEDMLSLERLWKEWYVYTIMLKSEGTGFGLHCPKCQDATLVQCYSCHVASNFIILGLLQVAVYSQFSAIVCCLTVYIDCFSLNNTRFWILNLWNVEIILRSYSFK